MIYMLCVSVGGTRTAWAGYCIHGARMSALPMHFFFVLVMWAFRQYCCDFLDIQINLDMYDHNDFLGSTAVNLAANHCPCPGNCQHTPPPHISAMHFKVQPWRETQSPDCPLPASSSLSAAAFQRVRPVVSTAQKCTLLSIQRACQSALSSSSIPDTEKPGRRHWLYGSAGHVTLLCIGLYATVISA